MDISMIHTNDGLALLAKLEQGIPLRITRVCSGAGRSDDLPNLTALTDQKQTLEITGQSQKGPQATIYVRLTNAGLAAGYDLTQIGVFAEDPDKGEILYRVAQFERAIPMPSEKDFVDYSFVFQIIDVISNASQVDVYVDPTGMVTAMQFQDAVAGLQSEISEIAGDGGGGSNNGKTVIATRTRDPNKPTYGVGSGVTSVALDTGPYTDAAEVAIEVNGVPYSVNMSTDGVNAPDGTMIIKKLEE